MSWDDLRGDAVRLMPSPADTTRFGLAVSRVTVGVDASLRADEPALAGELTRVLAQTDADVLVLRYPAAALPLAACAAASGRAVIPAGCLTYWAAPVAAVRASPAGVAADLDVVGVDRLGGGAEALMDRIVADSFTGYANHYAADPLLAPEAAAAGYQEWARSTLRGDPADVLVLRERGEPIGLATLAAGADPRDHLEVLLAGLVRAAQGGGRYGVLLAGAAAAAARRGRARLVISTQAHNVRVQRAWTRSGLEPFAAVETVHVVRPGLLAAAPMRS